MPELWSLSCGCLEDVLKLSAGCLVGVLQVSCRYLAGVWRMFKGVWKVSGECLKGVRRSIYMMCNGNLVSQNW